MRIDAVSATAAQHPATLRPARPVPLSQAAPASPARDPAHNDVTARPLLWRRFAGDDWAAFDALPPAIRQRLREHAYDAWAVNALILWRSFRRQAGSARAERRLLRYLDDCEALERAAFAAAYRERHRLPLPHAAAGVAVLRDRRRAVRR